MNRYPATESVPEEPLPAVQNRNDRYEEPGQLRLWYRLNHVSNNYGA
ncbi:hypothetical protein EYZ11_001523 [Aspergillus tanneri]|uniref:Uncharacterized protein n=1 Tax=Aspergillus tanneri TaxID=1220188 RepID=A0A4S3JT26_9EURO|nr:hypothetical protein EYZ11_001523 [Aspergillus tanneri]